MREAFRDYAVEWRRDFQIGFEFLFSSESGFGGALLLLTRKHQRLGCVDALLRLE